MKNGNYDCELQKSGVMMCKPKCERTWYGEIGIRDFSNPYLLIGTKCKPQNPQD